MSARTAWATPGYWTLTATSRPSCSARAVDLADRGGGDRRLVELGERRRRASRRARTRSTLRMSAKRTFGAASRSSPSLRWNSSRYSSGTRPTSRNDITCPSFIAAPFIVPSAATICSRRLDVAALERLLLALLAARRGWPSPCRAGAPPGRRRGRSTRAVRAMREVGIRSLAMPRGYGVGAGVAPWLGRGGVRRHARRRRRRSADGRRGLARRRSRRRRRSASRSSSGVAVGVGRRRRASASASPSWTVPPKKVVRCCRETESPKIASSEAVTTTAAMPKASSAGDERQHDALAREEARRARARAGRTDRRPAPDRPRARSSSGSWTSKSRPPGWRTAVPWGVLRQTPTGRDLLDGLLEALGGEGDDDWCDGGGHQAAPVPEQRDDHGGRRSGPARDQERGDRESAGLLAAHASLR